MIFDPTITFGAILNAGVLFVGFVGAFVRIGGRIDLLAQRLEALEKVFEESRAFDRRLTTTEARLTNHSETLTLVQKDISDLRHLRGFITKPRGLDGEYN